MSKARQLADLGNVYDDGALSNRNLIINGAMQVAQRGTSETGVTSSGYYCVDRFQTMVSGLGTHTVTQEADGPSGFANSYKIEVTTADASPAASDYLFMRQKLEGQNLQQIAKGTADAKPMTLSFWVKSNVTGTYRVSVRDLDNVRLVGATYSVSSSATWEYVTILIPADTTGAFDNNNGNSLEVEWWLDSGTDWNTGATPTAWESQVNVDRNAGSNVNLGDTIGNYWQITGVQLEVGDTATPFEHRSYGQELALCQRYYEKFAEGRCDYAQVYGTAGQVVQSGRFGIEKRATPTITATGNPTTSGSTFSNGYTLGSIVGTSSSSSKSYSIIWASSDSGRSPGDVTTLSFNSTNYLEFDAEL